MRKTVSPTHPAEVTVRLLLLTPGLMDRSPLRNAGANVLDTGLGSRNLSLASGECAARREICAQVAPVLGALTGEGRNLPPVFLVTESTVRKREARGEVLSRC